MTQLITEEMKIHEDWYNEAKSMKMENLLPFLEKLTTEYGHDYGTICHAIAASAIAAATAVNATPAGGITGFQAGAVFWEFYRHWHAMNPDAPARLLRYENMLYPQYEHAFEKIISAETWKWLQEEAQKNLEKEKEYVSNKVRTHWQSIVNGQVPFGYIVKEDR